MLTNSHAQVAVEGLEGDLDGVAGGRGGRRVTGKAGQVGNNERPTDKAKELHQGGQQDQAAAAGGIPLQDLVGWLAEDVGVVEAAGEQGV